MTFKTRLTNFFKQRVLKPQMNRQDSWEKMVVDMPGATQGGENSPMRFNIPLNWKGIIRRCPVFPN